MRKFRKVVLKILILVIEFIYLPILAISALVMRLYRFGGSKRLKLSAAVLQFLGIYPIRDHYYEPLFNSNNLKTNPRYKRCYLV